MEIVGGGINGCVGGESFTLGQGISMDLSKASIVAQLTGTSRLETDKIT